MSKIDSNSNKIYKKIKNMNYLQIKFFLFESLNLKHKKENYKKIITEMNGDINLIKSTLNNYLSFDQVRNDKNLNHQINNLIKNIDTNRTGIYELENLFH